MAVVVVVVVVAVVWEVGVLMERREWKMLLGLELPVLVVVLVVRVIRAHTMQMINNTTGPKSDKCPHHTHPRPRLGN